MEFFFLVPWVGNEVILFCIVACIFFASIVWHFSRPIARIVRKFGAKWRDARIDGRDSELLKEREKSEEQTFWEQVQNLDNPVLSGDEAIVKTHTNEEKEEEEKEEEEKEKSESKKQSENEIEETATEDKEKHTDAKKEWKKQEKKKEKTDARREKEETQQKSTETDTSEKNTEKQESISQQKNTEKSDIVEEKKEKKQAKKENNTEKLLAILNEATTLVAREKLDEAQSIVINGLALKKDHKRLNLLLGTIYEKQKKYDAVEILYKDLAKSHPEDPQVIKSLADILIIKKKYTVAIALYEKLLTLSDENEETLFVLSHLARETEDWENAHRYTRMYQKQWPNNKDILDIESQSQIALGKRKEAIETLIKLKNISPYNADEIQSLIQKLVAEEEMAENFNSQNS